MSIFDDVTLEFDGQEYRIPSHRVMGAIAVVEDVITLKEIHDMANTRGSLKLSQIAAAYAALLRYAGAPATTEQVYVGMFDGGAAKAQEAVTNACLGLLAMLIPPSAMTAEAQAAGNSNRRARRAGARSSKKATKPSSATAG